jgi:tetraprenyl-beta-curcumene synthase
MQKLRDERFNAEVAATLATLAPTAYREPAIEAIVAFEVMYDYLDGLTEQPAAEPLRDGRQLFSAFTDAVMPYSELHGDYFSRRQDSADGGYLHALAVTVREALRQLPSAGAIVEVAGRSAARCAEAQIRMHAAPKLGVGQLERWAQREAVETTLQWREFLAGAASSVLAVHALIASAADEHTTGEQATAIDAAYLSICALSTILDGVIDSERDLETGTASFTDFYEDRVVLAQRLAETASNAARQTHVLPNSAHHLMTLVGVVAYYTSAPSARRGSARPVTANVQRQLRPLITPTLAVMRSWRLAKRQGRLPRRSVD